MTAQLLLSSSDLMRVMTIFLFVFTQKRVMAPFNDNVLGLMRVICRTRVTLLSFGTREYIYLTFFLLLSVTAFASPPKTPIPRMVGAATPYPYCCKSSTNLKSSSAED